MKTFGERWLIDRSGNVWRQGDPRLARALNTTLAGEGLTRFAITNLGCISLSHSGTQLHIRCRPMLLSQASFASLCYFLFDNRWCPIGLSVLSEQWVTQIYSSSADIVSVLARLAPSDTAGESKSPYKGIVSVEVPELKSPFLQPNRVLHNLNSSIDTEVFDRTYNGRWSIGHFDPETRRFVFDRMGPGFSGSVLSETLRDPNYFAWVESSRIVVLTSNRPIFEAIDAMVTTSNGPQRLRYHRVMASLGRGDGAVFSASVDDTSINLRKAG